MSSSPLISVIVPVYNVEGYLRKSVNSILSQTYSNIEVILVDDGSKDNSSKICDELATNDSRIVCIHKKNGGLSSARNTALNICKGQYITFVDSDDMIAPNALELLLHYAIKCESDIVVTKKVISFSDDNMLPKEAIMDGYKTLNNLDAIQEILCKTTRWEAWGHLFEKHLWDDTRFPEGKLYEDIATTPYLFIKANIITILDTSIYYYFQRAGSIMRQSEQKISIDLCDISEELIAFFEHDTTNKSICSNTCSGILMELCSRTDLAAQNINNNREFVNIARRIMRQNAMHMLNSTYYSIKQKIYYLMEAYGFHWLIYKIHKK